MNTSSNTLYWAGGVIVIILIVLGLWWTTQSKSQQSEVSATTTVESTQTSKGSLASLVARGGSSQCNVTHASGNDTTSGVVYVSDGKVRGDFDSSVAGKSVQSHMISDGSDVYVWSNMMQGGMKMKAKAKTETGTSTATATNKEDPYDQEYDYNCSAWSADPVQFILPANITFSDMSALIPGSATTGAKASGSAGTPAGLNCAMCDQAPTAESKASCKKALHCK